VGVKKILVKKGKREFIKELAKEVVVSRPGMYYVDSLDRDFHTEYGVVKKKDLAKRDGSKILSSTRKEFFVLSASFIDRYRKIKRSAQIIPLKDIAMIVAETGINQKSVVVDAGTGSGALACFLAHLAKEVVSYDIRDDFIEIAERNKELLGLTNLTIKKKDVYKAIDEREVDLITLDLPEPWKAIPSARKALRVGGFLVAYNPSITQITDFVNEIQKQENFLVLKTAETTERNWEVEGRRVRPQSHPIGHSGFLAFVRKLR
jgi:tRNA (adenine57-N1/adenine58-N1)-methyltransferase